MASRLKPVEEQVIVLTGASSGIGLATARRAARRGARLVLAARNAQALQHLADEINSRGGQAVPVVADVGNEEDVRRVAATALERFGHFDTWVNDAGVGMYGWMLDIDTADHRRLFETNFWGVVYGSLEAARHLRHHGGAIVNVGSEASDRAVILLGMYSASKHAVKGFTDALRMELEAAKAPVSVTLVKPAAINTPFPQHAKTYLEEEPTLPPPVYDPEIVAEVILHCAENPVRDTFVGGSAKQHALQGALMPRLTDWLMELLYVKKQKSGQPANRSDDALYRPTTGLRERGAYVGHVRKTSVYTRAALHPLFTSALVVGAGIGLTALMSQVASDGSQGSDGG